MPKSKRKRKKPYRPYEPVKMTFFSIPDPFGDAPAEVRRQALREAGARARATFETEYPKLAQWFDGYDPLYILSFCAFYFMTSERGIDREALEGKIDFGFHHLELLQAFALMRPRLGAPTPLLQRAEELKKSVKEITECHGLRAIRLSRAALRR